MSAVRRLEKGCTMQIVTLILVFTAISIVYLAVGFWYFVASVVVWKSEWTVWWRRFFAAIFFPFAYFLDGKTEPELAYPLFERHATRVYFWVSIFTWPRIVATFGIALFLGFGRIYGDLTGPVPASSNEDED